MFTLLPSGRAIVGWPLVASGLTRSQSVLAVCIRPLSGKVGLDLRLRIDGDLSGTVQRRGTTENQ